MSSTIITPRASKTLEVANSIAVQTNGTCSIYYRATSTPTYFYKQSTLTGGEVTLTPGASIAEVRIEAGIEPVYYTTGTSPTNSVYTPSQVQTAGGLGESVFSGTSVRTTITDAGTVTAAEVRLGVLYQDASLGSVSMTSPTGTELDTEFPNLSIGSDIPLRMCSNHASNTSTIGAGAGITLVGSGAVTETGGSFTFIKTGANAYDLIRHG